MDDLEARVLKVVRRIGGKCAAMTSELYHDLHIYGDDVDDLINEVHAQFSTSFVGFNALRYFPNETEAFPRFLKWFGFRDKKFGSFTVGHLRRVVRQGAWFEPEMAVDSESRRDPPPGPRP